MTAPNRILTIAFALLAPITATRAEPAPAAPHPSIVVTGEGVVHVAPDYAQIRTGVTTRAKTVKEATDTNSKLMAAITAALADAGIAPKDIQTSRFSVQPVYAPGEPRTEPKLAGYSVSNQVTVIIRQVGKVSDVLDRVVTAGATDIGGVAFLVAEPSKALDQAREAAVADAKRKADVYAKAAGIRVGDVEWISEENAALPPILMARAASPGAAAAPPIASGEDTLRARITVAFAVAR
jgi:uncharacterized protein